MPETGVNACGAGQAIGGTVVGPGECETGGNCVFPAGVAPKWAGDAGKFGNGEGPDGGGAPPPGNPSSQ